MNRWQFKLNNLGHKQASYHHPLFRRGRQDLAMQMAPIRQKQYGSGDRNSSNSRKQSKSFETKTTTNETKIEKQVRIPIQMPDNSSSDDEDEFTVDKDDRIHTMDRNSSVEGWKMESKSQSSSLVAAACHTNHGDKTSHHYSTQPNNLDSYDVSSQTIMHPPSIRSKPTTQEMETPYNHNILYHLNVQHFMNHMQIQPTFNLPTSQSMPYHMHQSSHKENSHHQWFPHDKKHHQKQQQSYPWMQKQDPILTVPKPSYPIKDQISFTHANSTTSIPSTTGISSKKSQELIEYYQKLMDYLSQYQRSNDLEISKRAIEHLKKIQQANRKTIHKT
jgi:hypothetical protein